MLIKLIQSKIKHQKITWFVTQSMLRTPQIDSYNYQKFITDIVPTFCLWNV